MQAGAALTLFNSWHCSLRHPSRECSPGPIRTCHSPLTHHPDLRPVSPSVSQTHHPPHSPPRSTTALNSSTPNPGPHTPAAPPPPSSLYGTPAGLPPRPPRLPDRQDVRGDGRAGLADAARRGGPHPAARRQGDAERQRQDHLPAGGTQRGAQQVPHGGRQGRGRGREWGGWRRGAVDVMGAVAVGVQRAPGGSTFGVIPLSEGPKRSGGARMQPCRCRDTRHAASRL